jgi:hypothetical protein
MAGTHPLVEAFARLSRQDQGQVFAALARQLIAGRNGEATIPLADADGAFVGYLFGAKRSTPQPRPRTPEERAEDERRLNNRHDAVSAEEIMALIRAAENRPVVGS